MITSADLELKLKLEFPLASLIEIHDTSNGCGQAFKVLLVDDSSFESLSLLKRHQKVNKSLKDQETLTTKEHLLKYHAQQQKEEKAQQLKRITLKQQPTQPSFDKKLSKLLFFKNHLQDSLQDALDAYLSRFDQQLHSELLKKRPGRPLPSKCQLLQSIKEEEEKDYSLGLLEVPSFDPDNLKVLKQWDASKDSSVIKMIKVERNTSADMTMHE